MEQPKKQTQTRRFSDAEISLIKNTFLDNEPLLKAIRKVFLQMPLSENEAKIVIQTFKGKPELESVMRKTFLPQLDGDAPVTQVVDLWMTVEIKDKLPEQAYPILLSRQLLIDYLQQQLDQLLISSTNSKLKLSDMIVIDENPLDVYVNMVTRNTVIHHVEQQLQQFTILASQETEHESQVRTAKNSAK